VLTRNKWRDWEKDDGVKHSFDGFKDISAGIPHGIFKMPKNR